MCHPVTCLCLPVDEGLISIYLPRPYVTLLQHRFLKQHRDGARLQGILFQICYEYKVRRVNNILIISHPVTLILDNIYIYNHTNFIYCVNSYINYDSFDNALLFASERMQDGVGLGQV